MFLSPSTLDCTGNGNITTVKTGNISLLVSSKLPIHNSQYGQKGNVKHNLDIKRILELASQSVNPLQNIRWEFLDAKTSLTATLSVSQSQTITKDA